MSGNRPISGRFVVSVLALVASLPVAAVEAHLPSRTVVVERFEARPKRPALSFLERRLAESLQATFQKPWLVLDAEGVDALQRSQLGHDLIGVERAKGPIAGRPGFNRWSVASTITEADHLYLLSIRVLDAQGGAPLELSESTDNVGHFVERWPKISRVIADWITAREQVAAPKP
jgi:hypothetical protein